MWLFGVIVGVALGYLFKPQLDVGVQKVLKMIKDGRSGKNGPTY